MIADPFLSVVRHALRNMASSRGSSVHIRAGITADTMVLSIRDEGMGFDPAENEKLFEKFTSSGKKGVEGEHSTGLGLYLSRRIIERHGGKLIAEGQGADQGAIFTIYLPLHKSGQQLS